MYYLLTRVGKTQKKIFVFKIVITGERDDICAMDKEVIVL
jgi:hypothetical protein